MRISLFVTCINDSFFPQAGRATVHLLERLGHDVEFRAEQTCCGQMHSNSGYPSEALTLVRRFVDVFRDAPVVVIPSTSCTTTLRTQYPRLAAADAALLREVENLLPRVFELSEFLTEELGLTELGAYYPHRVTYHASCNSLRSLRLGDGPRNLLAAVRGIDLVDLPAAEECCGFGGTFAIKNPDISTAMLTDKLRAVLATGAEIVTAGDNSCLMHIGGGLARMRAGVRTVHLAEILASTETDIAA